MASLDVESLFTNVPVDITIQMILDKVYRDNSTPSMSIPESSLKSLLELCTKQAPFRSHHGHMFVQEDGVAMGSPLGPLFANFYMGTIEERVFDRHRIPFTYCRYIDDTFVCVKDEDELKDLCETFMEESGLNFTYELNNENKLPFLDVHVTQEERKFHTEVYTKPTDLGLCLNGNSECPKRYKKNVVNAYVRRALTHCSDWKATHKELDRIMQVLVNNGYSNKEIQHTIRKTVDKWYNNREPHQEDKDTPPLIKLYYRGFMNNRYQEEEKALQDIIQRNVSPTNSDQKIKLTIYYKNKKSSQLLMKNNPAPPENHLRKTNVVYRYKCPIGGGCPHSYIGLTTTRLSKRISNHLQGGAIYDHVFNDHGFKPTRDDVLQGFEVLDSTKDPIRLKYLEALYIQQEKPSLNSHLEFIILPTIRNRVEAAARQELQED